ncbi:MAG: orotidine-5'-phosphate decarboxylase [Ectothiorhodospiraceae bacterium]|nr:orotidine-5'-phosphate decarboxylase [Chromatiales bacterium]MCP5156897.1 orotidine-5'-phosphate decarboxylase [Ectothiorhodospiraceae bacterium]
MTTSARERRAIDAGSRIIVALDHPTPEQALALVDRLDPARCALKVGKSLFVRGGGPALVDTVQRRGFRVFLDLKFHDIPHQVAGACRAAADLGVWLLTVHASGGPQMLAAAREGVGDGPQRPLVVAVTVLTSLDAEGLAAIGIARGPSAQAKLLAGLAQDSGVDGLVCSPVDLADLADVCEPDFLRVTPGVRPAGSAADDQARISTPGDAIRAGAHHLVIGRPITGAPDPHAALVAIEREVAQALRS